MTIEEMHYDFKMKLNKVDSQQYRNFLIPEIDWLLNEAQELFIKIVAEPRLSFHLGFEKSQRNTDDIKMLIKETKITSGKTENKIGYNAYLCDLPEDYMFFIRGLVYGSTDNCKEVPCSIKIRQHDDINHGSPFDKSSIVWREINGMFIGGKLELELPDSKEEKGAALSNVYITYIRTPKYMHFAQGIEGGGGYQLNSDEGSLLNGKQDCELSPHTHREIVDIAVMLANGQLQIQDPFKMAKLNLNQLNN